MFAHASKTTTFVSDIKLSKRQLSAMDLESGDEAMPAVALAGVVAKMSNKKLEGTLVELNNITDEMGLIKPNPTVGKLNVIPPCRNKTTKIQLSKLEFESPPKYGDTVTRRANGERGMFLGIVNASKTKCAVVWECTCDNCKHKSAMVSTLDNSGSNMADAGQTTHSVEPLVDTTTVDADVTDLKSKDTIGKMADAGQMTHAVEPRVDNTTVDADVTDLKRKDTIGKMPDTGKAIHAVGPQVTTTTADSNVKDLKPNDTITNTTGPGGQGLSRSVQNLAIHFVFTNIQVCWLVSV